MKDQTKRNLVNGAIGIACILFGALLGHICFHKMYHLEGKEVPVIVEDTVVCNDTIKTDTVYIDTLEVITDMDGEIARIVPHGLQKVCKAIIHVESKGDAAAYRESGNCAGILQLTPIWVEDCNRIQKNVEYTLEDRYDVTKSLEMFVIVNRHYNPECDTDKAIQLHNPTAGPEYKAKVLRTIY